MTDDAVLATAVDRSGRRPLPWAAAPLLSADRVVELCCGTGLLADELPAGRWLGVDATRRTGRGPRLCAAPTALPLGTSTVDGLALPLALPQLDDLDGVFAELRRVLRPGGTLVLLVPSAIARSVLELRLAPAFAGVHRHWRHRSALDRTGWLLAAADFAVLGDDRLSFALPLPDGDAARDLVTRLPRAGLWPPHLPAEPTARALAGLIRLAGPGQFAPLPLRRVIARR